jgi:hypothetical protein
VTIRATLGSPRKFGHKRSNLIFAILRPRNCLALATPAQMCAQFSQEWALKDICKL